MIYSRKKMLDIDDKTLVFYIGEVYKNTMFSISTKYNRRTNGRK